MSAARKDFEIVLDGGTPVVWAKDREAWRRGMAREAVSRAEELVHLLRRRQVGSYEPRKVVEVMLLDQIERLLSSASLLTTPESLGVGCDEECADDVLGPDRCEGTLTVTGVVIGKGVEGDPELSRLEGERSHSSNGPGSSPGNSSDSPPCSPDG